MGTRDLFGPEAPSMKMSDPSAPFSLLPPDHGTEIAQRESTGIRTEDASEKPRGKKDSSFGVFPVFRSLSDPWKALPIWEEPKVTILFLLWETGPPWQLCDHSGSALPPHETVTQGNEVTAGWINIGAALACGYQ